MMSRIKPIILCAAMCAVLLSACSHTASMMYERGAGNTPEARSAVQTYIPGTDCTDGMKEDGRIHVYLMGKEERLDTPDSTFIDYLLYYGQSEHLIISMNGKEYVFANISASLWRDFCAAQSKGSFYNDNIRDRAGYLINDYDGTNGDLIVMEKVPIGKDA